MEFISFNDYLLSQRVQNSNVEQINLTQKIFHYSWCTSTSMV